MTFAQGQKGKNERRYNMSALFWVVIGGLVGFILGVLTMAWIIEHDNTDDWEDY